MQNNTNLTALIGTTIGQYHIVESIGTGSITTVFKAYQPALDRYVAIKIFPPYQGRDPDFDRHFLQQIHMVAKLDHPHILPIYDLGTQHDQLTYLVLEYIDDGTLNARLKQALPIQEAINYILQAAEALSYAHHKAIVHGNVKPGNMFLRRDNTLLLADFGLTKLLEATTDLTPEGSTIRNPLYMSPEQLGGEAVDRRSDLYSLGIVFFQCLTGQLPFTDPDTVNIAFNHLYDPLPIDLLRQAHVPPAIEQVVVKMTAKAPQDRYQSADSITAALKEFLANTHLPHPVVSPSEQDLMNRQSPHIISGQELPPAQTNTRIFVSHSSQDNALCIKLVQDLQRLLGDETAVWYDAGGLRGGDSWWRKIVREITARPIFLILLSPESMNSSWVNDEIDLAWRQKNTPMGKRIIPLLVRPCQVREDLYLQHIISFLPPKSYEVAFNELLMALGLLNNSR